jgi:two-component system nitrate/nitrite sensor histidine kinase NarX
MAISLRAAQENHVRELLAAEKAAEATRQEITRDMHDTLAQNLAYMQLKLDQMLLLDKQLQAEEFDRDLYKLRDVADESYDMVRTTLGALHPANSRRLGEILSQHAYTFADRVGLEIKFTQEGQPEPLDPVVIHHVYQLYREALNNVDKHAEANLVETSLVWMDEGFELKIKDNGCGFEPQAVDDNGHFGLEFMGERVAALNGEFSINGDPGNGTTITISVPSMPLNKNKATSTLT